MLNYSIDTDLSSNDPGISETIADFVSESEYDSDESAFFFLFKHFFNEAEMANLTQNMIDTLQQAGYSRQPSERADVSLVAQKQRIIKVYS